MSNTLVARGKVREDEVEHPAARGIPQEVLKILSARRAQASTDRTGARPRGQGDPMTYTVTLIPGDGIGPEVAAAAVRVLSATGVGDRMGDRERGRGGHRAARGIGRSPRTSSTPSGGTRSRSRGPRRRPIGTGHRSVNVELRKTLDLYANVRPVRTLPGREEPLRRTSTSSSCARTPRTSTAASSTWWCRASSSRSRSSPRRPPPASRSYAFDYARAPRPQAGHRRPQGQHHEAVGRPLPRLLPRGRRRATPRSRTTR